VQWTSMTLFMQVPTSLYVVPISKVLCLSQR
jgi:hypothetical protein